MRREIILVCLGALFSASGCKDFLNLQPIDSPTEGNFYVNENALQGAVVSCYDAIQSDYLYGYNMCILAENRGDNVADANISGGSGVTYQIDAFSEQADNLAVTNAYLQMYCAIFRCNMALDKAPLIKMDAAARNRLVGQALFFLTLFYFNIVRMWGKAPLILKVQTNEEARANTRSETKDIYAQIAADLNQAKDYLPTTWPESQRGRATSHAARGLLAKVYLYLKNYDMVISVLKPLVNEIYEKKEKKAVGLVPQTSTFPNSIKTSIDVIFAVQYLLGGVGESAHQNNRYRNQDGSILIKLPQSLFESEDNRNALMQQPPVLSRPGKFNSTQKNKETSGDMPLIRCAEILLIYAEALNEARRYPDTEAFKAINAVRTNAGISALDITDNRTQADLRNAIWKERRLELALECDRWFDIVRTEQFSKVFPLVPIFKLLYPVPQLEINNINDPTGWQNFGYY